MALLDKGLLQRMVGALVLIAIAVIFVPMLFNRQDDLRHVTVDAPSIPAAPVVADIEMQPVEVPEAKSAPEGFEIIEEEGDATAATAEDPVPAPVEPPAPAPAPAPAAPAEPQKPEPRLDNNNLPVSWSIQLASLSNRASAESLQQTLRSQGYNAYIRTADGMNRVFVGPLVERSEANRLRDVLQRQQKLDGFVVRFKPEEG
ncbi:MAG TPA: cell division protein [Pseudomonas sp.]|jgi:DedD protein|uniref:SPOR domain-containing protein n=1 Tax=Stutzerimonas frequens TaxID=2968969 RepID=UPI000C66648C|nr:SPOR domain-containing protein [Stutzerimonas frequens]MAL93016.1 cell division protein [Pseudomonas sp.]MCD1638516.1 SPOR domain-containing protein [Stutzerimonas stutzeri]MBK3757395.1 SPOR domain-containing protein [Stutzerimonas frequens]MBK3872007.1 SPOR domain-containing protein [Stutzerimonas frequens]MBK3910342.1 SPOR domain-containing protein [Stutzerimonas frequens]|tara:strand:+ start:534 stop:1139 length:606 start_codon:yes stop_codon:yes gene_type:complete